MKDRLSSTAGWRWLATFFQFFKNIQTINIENEGGNEGGKGENEGENEGFHSYCVVSSTVQ